MSIDIRPVLLLVCAAVLVFSPLLMLFVKRERNGACLLGNILLTISLTALGLVFFFLFDLIEAVSASSVFLILGAGLSGVIFYHCRSRFSLCLGAVFIALILTAYFIDFSPVQPYRRFFLAIHKGMTETEVMTILHHEFPQGGHFPVPSVSSDPKEMVFSLDPKLQAYNAEIVLLTLQDGKVVLKKYWPD